MRAQARLRAEAAPGGGVRLVELTQAAPLGLRQVGDTVYLIGTAAGPLGDDVVHLDISVGAGARLTIRSVAASVTYAGWGAEYHLDVLVAEGAYLDWRLEPLVATQGCDHRVETRVRLATGAGLSWCEEVLLGRYGERPGRIDLNLAVDVENRPLLRHQLDTGPDNPAWAGPAVTAGYRAVGLHLLAGPGPLAPAASGEGWACMPLDGPATLTVVVAADLPALRQRAPGWPGSGR
ncbi:MAG: urease accessory protein [Acidimicrobiaceae bacterium]|jgi:urease accessory protein|nr:urease accessory protein [Acidimicrobiaceae bacterium]